MNLINKIFFLGSIKRKIILINPVFQLKIINNVVMLFVFVIAVFYSVNTYFIYSLKQKGVSAGLPMTSEYFTFLENSSRQMNLFFLVSAFLVLIVIYYFGLRLSHRIAGPLYTIDKMIDEIITKKQGKKIMLRTDDFFQEHAAKVNELIDLNEDLK